MKARAEIEFPNKTDWSFPPAIHNKASIKGEQDEVDDQKISCINGNDIFVVLCWLVDGIFHLSGVFQHTHQSSISSAASVYSILHRIAASAAHIQEQQTSTSDPISF